MDNLDPSSIDWALTHLTRFGDTDLFPVPFEYVAIKHDWAYIRDVLAKLNLREFKSHSFQLALVPKSRGGFRVATQLDPLDSILYAAIGFEAARHIEKARIPIEQNVACSYRIAPDSGGALFRRESGWREYHEQSGRLAQNVLCTHVLIADIADFYNQLYLHRVANAVEACGVNPIRASNIERFLLQLTAKQSRGVPVGPTASTLLAEATLGDVDNFLLGIGLPFVRFVDDFRIFCRSKREAVSTLHDMTKYLYTAHRLILEPGKTRITTRDEFLTSELRDPDQLEKDARMERAKVQLLQMLSEAGYQFSEEEQEDIRIEETDIDGLGLNGTLLTRETLPELFKDCISERPLHLGFARHLLRRATALRSNTLLTLTMQHLTDLAPVFRDTAKYLEVVIPKGDAKSYGGRLVSFIRDDDFGQLPYIRRLVFDVFEKRADLLEKNSGFELAKEFLSDVGYRQLALMARAEGRIDWVRGNKELWQNNGPWDRRAIIFSASILPSGERNPWLRMVMENGNHLDRAVASYSMRGK